MPALGEPEQFVGAANEAPEAAGVMRKAPNVALCWIAFLVLILPLGCGEETGLGIPALPSNILLSVPEVLVLRGQTLGVETSLWRDFQPISPPDGQPLIALVTVYSLDSSALPDRLTTDGLWIVHQDSVWRSLFSSEPPPPDHQAPWRITRIARNGPKWPPGDTVDVVVRVFDGSGTMRLLRAADQRINRTD